MKTNPPDQTHLRNFGCIVNHIPIHGTFTKVTGCLVDSYAGNPPLKRECTREELESLKAQYREVYSNLHKAS